MSAGLNVFLSTITNTSSIITTAFIAFTVSSLATTTITVPDTLNISYDLRAHHTHETCSILFESSLLRYLSLFFLRENDYNNNLQSRTR